MMRLASFKSVVFLSIAFVHSSIGVVGKWGDTDTAQEDVINLLKESHTPQKQDERIKVPLGRRLVDVLSDDNGSNPNTAARRRFEIEADNDTPPHGPTKLMVEEVHQMAITPQTTYTFHASRGEFNHNKIKDISILASNPKEHEGITIMSINKSNGDVRGFQRGRTGHTHEISHDETTNTLRVKRALTGEEEVREKNWSCDTAHAHEDDVKRTRGHAHGDDDDDDFDMSMMFDGLNNGDFTRRKSNKKKKNKSTSRANSHNAEASSNAGGGTWIEPTKYAFHIDLAIDIDAEFIKKQGGPEAAVEYVNFLVTAANMVFEHEVDAHLNIVHIEEQTLYDTLTTTKEALRAQRLHPRPHINNDGSHIILHHAFLGRYVGGGIAFIDSICDDSWGYGVTSDISGKLSNIDELVLFDFFIVTHEIGHSLGSGHTFDGYDPPVDVCGVVCTVQPQEGEEKSAVGIEGLPLENAATIMSYCNFCDGGLDNIAITLGGVWNGDDPKSNIDHWKNHPDIVGSVSTEPRRVSHNIWQKLSNKGQCVNPPSEPLPTQACNDDNDCDDHNGCTIDICSSESHLCFIYETLNNCCGNGKCEAGEGQSCVSDCGPFTIQSPTFCEENCHSLDGFMIDVGLNDKAKQRIFVSSISVAYSSPETGQGATIDVYVTTEGSYVGKAKSKDDWYRVTTVNVDKYNPRRETGFVEIQFQHSIPLDIGTKRGFYFAASEEIIEFSEGIYSVRNDKDQVEIHSSLAVSGLFGVGIDGFSLSCKVSYLLDDSGSPSLPIAGTEPKPNGSDRFTGMTSSPSSHPSPQPVIILSPTPKTEGAPEDTGNAPEEIILAPITPTSGSQSISDETHLDSPVVAKEATETSTGSKSQLLVGHYYTNSIMFPLILVMSIELMVT